MVNTEKRKQQLEELGLEKTYQGGYKLNKNFVVVSSSIKRMSRENWDMLVRTIKKVSKKN